MARGQGYGDVSMLTLTLPRHACTPRDTARAGDLWRLVQDAAVHAATEGGWPPERFRACGTGFVVREMRAIHVREAHYGECLSVATQVAEHKRDVLVRRETQIDGVLLATADWVHIGPGGAPQAGSPALLAGFPVEPAPAAPVLPAMPEGDEPLPAFTFSPWWTEMDPLGHTNHPRYVDWADEALSRAMFERGVDPVGLVPIAEKVRFRAGARATDTVTLTGKSLGTVTVGGRTGGAYAFRARRGAEAVADMLIIRGHVDKGT